MKRLSKGYFVPYQEGLGLADLPDPLDPLYKTVEMVHLVYQAHRLADQQQKDALLSDDPNVYLPALGHFKELEQQVDIYEAKKSEVEKSVKTEEAQKILSSVREKYFSIDILFNALNPTKFYEKDPQGFMIEWAALRSARFDGVQIGVDIDKTLSTDNTDYLAYILGNPQLENALKKNNRENFPWLMARYVRRPLLMLSENFKKVGEKMNIRPGVLEFFADTEQAGIPTTVISAQFKPIVEAFCNRISLKPKKINAIEADDISAIDKSTVTAKTVLSDPSKALFLFFDGLTDKGCIEGAATGISTCVFVLEGSEIISLVKQAKIPFFTFSDFRQNREIMSKILFRREEIKQRQIK